MIPNAPNIFYVPGQNAPAPIPKPVVHRARPPKKASLSKEPATLSGFKKLKSLAILDIDSLDIITELKTCVRNSSGTLSKLKLSFSDQLAMQARKPEPDMDPEDSDPDDDFQVVPVPPAVPSYNDDVSGPARAFRAQEEKKSQESVLGRIFDVEPYVVKKAPKKSRDKEKEVKDEQTPNPGQNFINAIKVVSAKLMRDLNNGNGDFTASQQEILSTIELAARKYVASEETKLTSAMIMGKPDEPSAEAGSSQSPEPQAASAAAASDISGSLFDQPAAKVKESQKDASPEDIIIEEPEEQLAEETQDMGASDTKDMGATETSVPESSTSIATSASSNTTNPGISTPDSPDSCTASQNAVATSVVPGMKNAIATLAAQKVNFKTLAEKLEHFEACANALFKEIQELRASDGPVNTERISEAEKQMSSISRDIQDIQKEMDIVEAEIDDAEKQIPVSVHTDAPESHSQRISEYLRSTRGLALKSLSIHLIPVKASVLSRAIDLRVLRRLTLLNVGPQAPIWAHLQKENKESPLPLRKVFTDNVSMVFLTFVSQLEELHEFFIVERDAKYKPESFAPKTTTTIDQIRRLVLKKHMPTLQRLMIKNMSDTSWDVNEKTVMLICRRGKQLDELACSMGIRVTVSVESLSKRVRKILTWSIAHIYAATGWSRQSTSSTYYLPQE